MTQKQLLQEIIINKVFILNKDESFDFKEDPNAWIFDFRRILMNGEVANLISDIFYDKFSNHYPIQLGALEIAGVPLVTSFMTKFYFRGHKDINAFFIRKSRKKTGLMRMIEGVVETDKPIILVDDILNSGNSFWRQVEVLEQLGHKVDTVWAIIQFRDDAYYQRFTDRGIRVQSLFTLDDFTADLGPTVKNIKPVLSNPTPMPFTPCWRFQSKNPAYGHVVSKSQPVLDDTNIYVGSDNRTFWSIRQSDGSVVWKYRVGFTAQKKSIFSNPVLYKDIVIFGSYDGNLYALEKETGKRIWVYTFADWIGSSPALAEDLDMVFVGLEFGLFRKRGGIAGIQATTGKLVWIDTEHPALTHSSPLYIQKHQQIAIGSNDGKLRLYDAKTGKLIWTFVTDGGQNYDADRNGGFGEGDIKESPAYDPARDYIVCASIDGNIYIVHRKDGSLVYKYTCEFGIFSTPLIYKDRVYFSSADKHLRCLSLITFEIVFDKNIDNTRIFGSPCIIENRLYIGTNAGRLHELNPDTGEVIGYFQATERITNALIYNQNTRTYFLPTYANEIICLKRNN